MIFLKHFKTIKISKPAELDLKNIAEYTLNQWGESQKKAYLDLFKQFYYRLIQNEGIDVLLLKTREDIDAGLLSYHIKKHVVYLRLTEHEFLILRVLHSRMDPEKHLIE